MTRLWHDDIRPAPEGWVWARTNDEAMRVLRDGNVDEISLDFDLGLHDLPEDDPGAIHRVPFSEENGGHLVAWMIAEGFVPAKIRIHSWNAAGARRMARALNDHGHDCEVRPFDSRYERR